MYADHKNPTHHIYCDPPMANGSLTIDSLLSQPAQSWMTEDEAEPQPQMSRAEWWAIAGIAVFLIVILILIVK